MLESCKASLDLEKETDKDLYSLRNRTCFNQIISAHSSLDQKKIHRVVLTGGPCSGKSTCLNRLKTFFQNIGWKVFCVPETATILLSTGINFYDFDVESKMKFQENLLKNLIQIEDSINQVAKFYQTEKNLNCIIIYDRGAMDPVSYLEPEEWQILKEKNPNWNEVDLRDNRYDQVIHLITAAKGAEEFYTLENNKTRTETIEMARELDEKCAKSWIGHPCLDIIENYCNFETKVTQTLKVVSEKIGLNLKGFGNGTKKRKFLVKTPLPEKFPDFNELKLVHNYLISSLGFDQIRLRKSGDGNNWSYSYSVRALKEGQLVETRTQISKREYSILSKSLDPSRATIIQRRRCFIWKNRYFRLDIYQEPVEGLVLLSTRSEENDFILPDFLTIEKEVTDDSSYFMANFSLKKDN